MARLVASVVLLLAVVLGAEKGRNIPYFFGKRYFRMTFTEDCVGALTWGYLGQIYRSA